MPPKDRTPHHKATEPEVKEADIPLGTGDVNPITDVIDSNADTTVVNYVPVPGSDAPRSQMDLDANPGAGP